MLRADIGMAELARRCEGVPERAFHPRRHADFPAFFCFLLAVWRVLLELAAQFVGRDLELLKNCADDVALR